MEVVGIGIPNIDLLGHIKELPRENESAGLLEYSWQGGGKVPTAIVALARLGISTGMVGVVGDCCYGQFCIEDFKRHKIDTSKLIIDKGKSTGFAIVLSEDKTNGRNILYKPGSARSILIDDLDRDYIVSAKYLHLAEVNPATIKAAQWAGEAGVQVVFDADWHSKEIEDILPFIDVFIASEFYYKSVFKDLDYETSLKKIIMIGPKIAVFTLGERGCMAADEKGFYEIHGFYVKVRDTTGAGDVYHGAFIYGLLQNWDTAKTARFANAVSAIKCTRIGGRAGIPDLETAMRFLEGGIIDYREIDERVKYYENGIGR